MWFANFLVAASMTMIMPFLSLIIESMGNYPSEFVQKWAGLVFGVTFITAFFFSPIWGRFGDRHGRKKVLIILSLGVSVCIFLMGFVHSVYLLFFLRLCMGIFAGFISMAQAFISSQAPKEKAGRVLGTLQTGNVTGALFGPLIGGLLADTVGFKYTFILTASLTALTSVLIFFMVKEVSIQSIGKEKGSFTRKQVFQLIFKTPMLLIVMIVGTLIQVAHFSIQPLLALYVSELNVTENIAFLSGAAFSAAGLGNLMFAREWGKLGDRYGHEKVLGFLLIAVSLVYLPQAFVTSVWQLMILRVFLGMVLGGFIPCITAYIRQTAPLTITGEILGYNTSFRFLGNMIGPVLGGFLSAHIGISSVFYVTSSLLFLSSVILWTTRYRYRNIQPEKEL